MEWLRDIEAKSNWCCNWKKKLEIACYYIFERGKEVTYLLYNYRGDIAMQNMLHFHSKGHSYWMDTVIYLCGRWQGLLLIMKIKKTCVTPRLDYRRGLFVPANIVKTKTKCHHYVSIQYMNIIHTQRNMWFWLLVSFASQLWF